MKEKPFTEPNKNWFEPIRGMERALEKAGDNSNFALEQLRALMVSAHISKNEKLPPERDLAQQLGVSRRAVRRALEVLEAEGSVWRRQGAGTFLGSGPAQYAGEDIDELHAGADIMQVMEVRLRIEPQLAQLAALRAAPQDVARMRELAEKIRLSAGGDADSRELWDGALHRHIAQSAGNPFFLRLFDMVNRVRQSDVWQSVREASRSDADMSVSFAQHSAIIDAIEARSVAGAGEAMLAHLLSIQENLIRRTSMSAVVLPMRE